MNSEKKTERFANIELLRIVAMYMIIVHHFCVHGIFPYFHSNISWLHKMNNIFAAFGAIGGKLGVCLFVLITGYFMINSTSKLSSFLRVYLKTFIYSILFLLIALIYGNHHIPSNLLNSSLFPLFGSAYWFVTYYLFLYIFIPFINLFIKNIVNFKDNTALRFFMLSSLFLMIIPTFFHVNYNFGMFCYFAYFYIVGAFIRLGQFKFLTDLNCLNKIAKISILFIFGYILLVVFSSHSYINLWKTFRFCNFDSIFILIIATWMLNLFLKFNIQEIPLLSKVSGGGYFQLT